MVIKELRIQRKSTYDSSPGTLYGSVSITGHGGSQDINLSGAAMAAILTCIQLEVTKTAKAVAKDVPIAFQNTVGELEVLQHPLAQIEA